MSFGYIQGQEAEALFYFHRLLNQPLSPADRKQLEELVRHLRQKVEDEKQHSNVLEPALHNAPVELNLAKG